MNPEKKRHAAIGHAFPVLCMHVLGFWICLVFDLEDLDEIKNSSLITHNFHASNSECMGGMLRSLHPT